MNATAATKATTRAETYEQVQQRRREARAQWKMRALELAFAHQLVGAAHLEHENFALGVRTYRVPSSDRRGDYLVTVCGEGDDQRVTCTCPAAIYSHGKLACGHAGSVVHAEGQRAAAMRGSEGNCAWDWWMDGGVW